MAKKPIPAAAKAPARKPTPQGRYVYKPIISIVVLCVCGNKYIKTRDRQTECLRCIQNR